VFGKPHGEGCHFSQIAPGLYWLDSACVWQLQRRSGYHYELQPPEAAIPPEEDAVSIDAAIVAAR